MQNMPGDGDANQNEQKSPVTFEQNHGEDEQSPQPGEADDHVFAGETGAVLVVFIVLSEKVDFHDARLNLWIHGKATRSEEDKRCCWPHWQKQANETEKKEKKAQCCEKNYF